MWALSEKSFILESKNCCLSKVPWSSSYFQHSAALLLVCFGGFCLPWANFLFQLKMSLEVTNVSLLFFFLFLFFSFHPIQCERSRCWQRDQTIYTRHWDVHCKPDNMAPLPQLGSEASNRGRSTVQHAIWKWRNGIKYTFLSVCTAYS